MLENSRSLVPFWVKAIPSDPSRQSISNPNICVTALSKVPDIHCPFSIFLSNPIEEKCSIVCDCFWKLNRCFVSWRYRCASQWWGWIFADRFPRQRIYYFELSHFLRAVFFNGQWKMACCFLLYKDVYVNWLGIW